MLGACKKSCSSLHVLEVGVVLSMFAFKKLREGEVNHVHKVTWLVLSRVKHYTEAYLHPKLKFSEIQPAWVLNLVC